MKDRKHEQTQTCTSTHIHIPKRQNNNNKKKKTGIGDDSMLQLFDKKCKITMTKDFIRSG